MPHNADDKELRPASGPYPDQVSLWIGRFASEEALDEYLRFDYSDEAKQRDPQICRDFRMESFDEDFREAFLVETDQSNYANWLEGCSYDDQLISQFEASGWPEPPETEGMNAVILLYDYSYDGSVPVVQNSQYSVRFIGSVVYED